MTGERLAHLQRLDQQQWEQERKNIMDRNPPKLLSDAIRRTQERLRDLDAMNDDTWEAEKKRLSQRFQRR